MHNSWKNSLAVSLGREGLTDTQLCVKSGERKERKTTKLLLTCISDETGR